MRSFGKTIKDKGFFFSMKLLRKDLMTRMQLEALLGGISPVVPKPHVEMFRLSLSLDYLNNLQK